MKRCALALLTLCGVASADRAATRTIFLDRGGVLLTPGRDNARTHVSSLVAAPTQVPAWNVSDATWTATVSCMQEMWARFDVTVTETDPGDVPYIDAIFGGEPSDMGRPSTVAGLSPFAADCGVIESSIVVTFAQKLPQDAEMICEVMSQEIGHSYGLDHELAAKDPMTYLPYSGDRSFVDVDAQCGEATPRPCGSGPTACRATQNSVQILRERLGDAGGDDVAPVLVVSEPSEGASVAAGFHVAVAATDNTAVASVALYVDGVRVATTTEATHEFATADDLAPGPHLLRVVAVDPNSNKTRRDLDVSVEQAVGCSAGGSPGLGIALLSLMLLRRRR